MLDLLIGKQRTYLQTFKPQRTNMYVVEFPRFVTNTRSSGISIGSGLAAAALGTFKTDNIRNPFLSPNGLLDISPDLGMVCDRIVLPGIDIETISADKMTYPDELPKSEAQKRVVFTLMCSADGGEYQAFRAWKELVFNSRNRKAGFWEQYAAGQDITITLYNSYMQPKTDIILKDCYPINISGLTVSYEDENAILKFDVTCVVRTDEVKPHGAVSSLVSDALSRLSLF